jgi:hypothetical protein
MHIAARDKRPDHTRPRLPDCSVGLLGCSCVFLWKVFASEASEADPADLTPGKDAARVLNDPDPRAPPSVPSAFPPPLSADNISADDSDSVKDNVSDKESGMFLSPVAQPPNATIQRRREPGRERSERDRGRAPPSGTRNWLALSGNTVCVLSECQARGWSCRECLRRIWVRLYAPPTLDCAWLIPSSFVCPLFFLIIFCVSSLVFCALVCVCGRFISFSPFARALAQALCETGAYWPRSRPRRIAPPLTLSRPDPAPFLRPHRK